MYVRQDKKQAKIGYGGYGNFGATSPVSSLLTDACNPAKANTCGMDGKCFDARGCPIVQVDESGRSRLLQDPSRISAVDRAMYKDAIADDKMRMMKIAAIGAGSVLALVLLISLLRRK